MPRPILAKSISRSLLERHYTTCEFLHNLFLQHQLELVPEIELSSNDLLIDFARIGLGIACVPDYCVREGNEDLDIIETKETMPARQIVQKFAGGAVTFQGDQWVAGKLRQAQYPGFQWVISRICHEYIMEFTDSFPDVRLV